MITAFLTLYALIVTILLIIKHFKKDAPNKIVEEICFFDKKESIISRKKTVININKREDGLIDLSYVKEKGTVENVIFSPSLLYDIIRFAFIYGYSNQGGYIYDDNNNLYPKEFAIQISEFTKKQLIPSTKNLMN